MAFTSAHRLFDNFRRAADEIRQLPISHIILNTITDPCVLSFGASAIMVMNVREEGGQLLRALNISGIVGCALARNLGEIKKARLANELRTFMAAGKKEIKLATSKSELNAIAEIIPEVGNLINSRSIELKRQTEKDADAPRYKTAWRAVAETLTRHGKKLDNTIIAVTELTPENSQFIVQPLIQFAIAVVTSTMILKHADTTHNVYTTMGVFGLNCVGNVWYFFNQSSAKKVENKPKENFREFFVHLMRNPYTYWSASFVVAGGTWTLHPTDIIANAAFGLAIAHTTLQCLPKTLGAVFDELAKIKSKKFRSALPVIREENFPMLALATGCAASVSKNILHMDQQNMAVMALYGLTCLSIYALRRYQGVAEAIDEVVASANARHAKKAARPPSKGRTNIPSKELNS